MWERRRGRGRGRVVTGDERCVSVCRCLWGTVRTHPQSLDQERIGDNTHESLKFSLKDGGSPPLPDPVFFKRITFLTGRVLGTESFMDGPSICGSPFSFSDLQQRYGSTDESKTDLD